MTSSPLSIVRFRIIFTACFFVLAIAQAQFLLWIPLTFREAIVDSAISNSYIAIACMAVMAGLRFYLPQQNRVIYFILWCVALAALYLFAVYQTLTLLLNDAAYVKFLYNSLPYRFIFSFLLLGWMALLTVLWYQQEKQRDDEKRKSDAERLNREAELFQIRQQLQPHFLFNSLNSINAMIASRPVEAKDMIQKLSEFLRGTIKKEDQWALLSDELRHLQLYLDIEKVRFGHRLNTEVTCDEASGRMKLPAMLLQPIVENAIKFGLYDTTGEVTISIHAAVKNNLLEVMIQNPFDPSTSSSNSGTGFGLTSVQRRLYLLFGRNDLLQTSSNENTFTTALQIPQPA